MKKILMIFSLIIIAIIGSSQTFAFDLPLILTGLQSGDSLTQEQDDLFTQMHNGINDVTLTIGEIETLMSYRHSDVGKGFYEIPDGMDGYTINYQSGKIYLIDRYGDNVIETFSLSMNVQSNTFTSYDQIDDTQISVFEWNSFDDAFFLLIDDEYTTLGNKYGNPDDGDTFHARYQEFMFDNDRGYFIEITETGAGTGLYEVVLKKEGVVLENQAFTFIKGIATYPEDSYFIVDVNDPITLQSIKDYVAAKDYPDASTDNLIFEYEDYSENIGTISESYMEGTYYRYDVYEVSYKWIEMWTVDPETYNILNVSSGDALTQDQSDRFQSWVYGVENDIILTYQGQEYDLAYRGDNSLDYLQTHSENSTGHRVENDNGVIRLYINGTEATQEFSIEIDFDVIPDTTAPTISGDSFFTSNYDTPETVATIKASLTADDNVDGDLSANITVLDDNFTGNEQVLANHTITFEVSDASGNTAQHTVTVSVEDTTAATITLNGDSVIYKEVGSTPCSYAGAYATDNVDGEVQLDGVCNVDTSAIGTYTIEYDYTDTSGNVSDKVTVTVYVQDTTPPYVEDNITSIAVYESANLSISQVLSEIVVLDGYDTTFDGTFTITVDNYTANKNIIGDHTVTISATDTYGNVMTHTITIEVVDDLDPVISGTNEITNDIDNPLSIASIQANLIATDDVDGDLTDSITISSNNYTANENLVGSFTIVFSVTDSYSQITEYTVTINNHDQTAPTIDFADFDSNTNIIRVPTNATIAEIRSTYLPQNFIIIDSYEGTLTESAIIYDSLIHDSLAINTSVNGDYAQVIRVTDSSGNTAELHYTIRVQDMTAPVIDAPSEIMKKDMYILSSNFFLAYFTATDNIDGDLTDSINIVSNEYIGNADTVGSYNIVLAVQDNDGNTTTHTLTIKVKSDTFSYLIIDRYKWILPSNISLTDMQFVQELKRINDLPDDNYVFTSVSDTYSANASENGSYQKVFNLSSGSGSSYSREINVSVVDPNTNLIEDDATFLENLSDFGNGIWIFIKKTWWIFFIGGIVIFGIYQNKK